jgi:hypothetical protein
MTVSFHAPRSRALGIAACCALALIIIITPRADAALLSTGLFAPADGLLTHDTATDLVWLDLDQTRGLSYNQVSADAGGWLTLGFRYATGAEVLALWTTAGMVSANSSDDANIPAVDLLASLMGATNAGLGAPYQHTTRTHAYIGDPASPPFRLVASLVSVPTLGHFNAWNSFGPDTTQDAFGIPFSSYLVADYDDVPSPGPILALVLAPLALARRRSRANPRA